MADLRHKRDTNARRSIRPALVAAPLALVATATVVAGGIALQGASAPVSDRSSEAAALSVAELEQDAARDDSAATDRDPIVSRSQARALGPVQLVEKAPNLMDRKVTRQAVKAAVAANTKRWTTDDLNLWTRPGTNAAEVGELDAATKVLVTGRKIWGRQEVVLKGKPLWVTVGYLSEEKPLGAGAGLSMAPCPDPSVENGLSDNAVYVYRSVCRAFPGVSAYGGYADRGEHASGRAIDIMTGDVTLGTAIADFLRANAPELELYNVIYRQRIYTQERGGEGWRGMPDRGSATANHLDHVHVSTY